MYSRLALHPSRYMPTGNDLRAVLEKLQPLQEPTFQPLPDNQGAHDDIAMPIQILADRLEDDVRAQIQRVAPIRREEGVVDHDQRAILLRDRTDNR